MLISTTFPRKLLSEIFWPSMFFNVKSGARKPTWGAGILPFVVAFAGTIDNQIHPIPSKRKIP
jgi:hypothetical protein